MTLDPVTDVERPLRHLPISGTYNFRDLGGYPTADGRLTRWRVLFRADALHRLDTAGQAGLAALGVQTVVDLREADELERSPNQLGALGATTLHRPMYDRGATGTVPTALGRRTLQDTYLLLVDERPAALAGVVGELALRAGTPSVVHCTAGKDRTGMVAALTLAALGVPDEVIADDFALTGPLLSGAFRDEILARSLERGIPAADVEPLLSADPTLILTFLDHVRARAGGVETFLLAHGMTAPQLAALRAGLLATDPEGAADPDQGAVHA